MAENKKSFLLYADLIHTVKKMPKEKAGELLMFMLDYVNDNNPETDDMIINLVFEPIKQQMKRDLVRWEAVRAKRSDAGKASAEAKKAAKESEQKSTKSTSVESVQQTSTKSTVNATVNVNDTVINNKDITLVVPTSDIDYSKFIQKFNSYANRNFRVTKGVKSSLNARLKDYTKNEILKAIEKAHKDQYHIESNFKYLTPEFILRPDKLEKFLNNPETKNKEYNPAHPQLTN